jgi:dihydroflavonol-4-reductase
MYVILFYIDMYLEVCDVRDVALAHIKAMNTPEAASHRHIVVSTVEDTSFKDWALILKAEFGPKGYSIPTMVAPNILIRGMSIFDKTLNLVRNFRI